MIQWHHVVLVAAALLVFTTITVAASTTRTTPASLTLCCSDDNDLYVATKTTRPTLTIERYDNCTDATIASAKTGSSLLLLVPGNNDHLRLSPFMLATITTHKIKTFAEAARMPINSRTAQSMSARQCPAYSRMVLSPNFFHTTTNSTTLPPLRPLDILEPNACRYIPYLPSPGSPPFTIYATLTKVAGFDYAVYGINKTTDKPVPLLFETPLHPGLLLSAIPLSPVTTQRYSPVQRFSQLWGHHLLPWLLQPDTTPETQHSNHQTHPHSEIWNNTMFHANVRPSFTATERLPPDASQNAVQAHLHWLHTTSNLLVASPAEYEVSRLLLQHNQAANGWNRNIYSLPHLVASNGRATLDTGNLNPGQGSLGIFEGYLSLISQGSQATSVRIRSDCVAESAAALSLGGWNGGNWSDGTAASTAIALLTHVFTAAQHNDGNGATKETTPSPLSGLLRWGTNVGAARREELFSDDQYRALLSSAFAATVLNTTAFHVPIARLLLSNARLINRNGCTAWLGNPASDLVANGWQHYHDDASFTSELQYFQASARAGNLFGYALTSNATVFLDRTVIGLNNSMQSFYAKKWGCQVGLTPALSRMILPLAWLVRVMDTKGGFVGGVCWWVLLVGWWVLLVGLLVGLFRLCCDFVLTLFYLCVATTYVA